MLAFSPQFAGTVFVIVSLSGALVSGLRAAPRGSLSDLDIEITEARMAAEKLSAENARLKEERDRLQEKLALAEASAHRMTEGMAIATGEAEALRRASGEYRLRLEAIGVEGGSGANNKIEQRLLAAASDWRIAEQERVKYREALKGLLEATQTFTAQLTPAERRSLEAPMRKAQDLLVGNQSLVLGGATLADGQVISLSDQLALVVMNIGSRQGVTSGMPFQVFRNNSYVGSIKVVDVREKIAGAVIENLSSERDRIKVGDRLKVAAQQ